MCRDIMSENIQGSYEVFQIAELKADKNSNRKFKTRERTTNYFVHSKIGKR